MERTLVEGVYGYVLSTIESRSHNWKLYKVAILTYWFTLGQLAGRDNGWGSLALQSALRRLYIHVEYFKYKTGAHGTDKTDRKANNMK